MVDQVSLMPKRKKYLRSFIAAAMKAPVKQKEQDWDYTYAKEL